MQESMKEELDRIKKRDKCENCCWSGRYDWCIGCRLSDGGNYFNPSLYTHKDKG